MLSACDPQLLRHPAPSPQHCTACMVWLPRCGKPAGAPCSSLRAQPQSWQGARQQHRVTISLQLHQQQRVTQQCSRRRAGRLRCGWPAAGPRAWMRPTRQRSSGMTAAPRRSCPCPRAPSLRAPPAWPCRPSCGTTSAGCSHRPVSGYTWSVGSPACTHRRISNYITYQYTQCGANAKSKGRMCRYVHALEPCTVSHTDTLGRTQLLTSDARPHMWQCKWRLLASLLDTSVNHTYYVMHVTPCMSELQ
jgi:hypothetical protein